MDNILEFFSQSYYYELDVRERIFSRLQFNFAIYISYFALIAYAVRMIDYQSNCIAVTLFFVGIFFSLILLSMSVYYSYRSLTGLDYRVMPNTQKILDYENKKIEYLKKLESYNTKKNIDDKIPELKEEMKRYIIEQYSKCSSFNSVINEKRKTGVRKSLRLLMLSSIPIIFSSTLFVLFDLDISSPRKETPIVDRSVASEIKELTDSIKTIHQQLQQSKGTKIVSNEINDMPPVPPEPPEWELSGESFEGTTGSDDTIDNDDEKLD